MIRSTVVAVIAAVVFAGGAGAEAPKAPSVLVTCPGLTDKAYRPVADVFMGVVAREARRQGGAEIVDRERAAAWLRERRLPEWAVDNRDLAREMGLALGADAVIYSDLIHKGSQFVYHMVVLEVKRDVIQRVVNGSFRDAAAPGEIADVVTADMKKINKYIPRPEDIEDPGLALREKLVNPDSLPVSAEAGLPPMDAFGEIEQVLSFYRVFPGDAEFLKLSVDQRITRIQFDEEESVNEALRRTYSRMQMYGEFALRYNLQAYLVKNCSVRALNVLIANKVPVFMTLDEENIRLVNGYRGLQGNGDCIFRSSLGDDFSSIELVHRNLIAVLVILPKPGKKGGISRESLQKAVGVYHNDWGKTPELVEIREGFLDIISGRSESE